MSPLKAPTSPLQRFLSKTSTPKIPPASSFARLSVELFALLSLSIEFVDSALWDLWCEATDILLGKSTGHSPYDEDLTTGRGAIVIQGAGEELGNDLALRLAALGYTCFVLLNDSLDNGEHSALRTLLANWHSLHKRLIARQPLHTGSLLPLLHEPSDSYDKPIQTVLAYCNSSSFSNLKLSTIHTTETSPPRPKRLVAVISVPRLCGSGGGTPLMFESDRIEEMMEANIREPLNVIRSFAPILHESKGRVVWIDGAGESAFSVSQPLASITSAARLQTAELLSKELRSISIQFCSIVAGPLVSYTSALAGPRREAHQPSPDYLKPLIDRFETSQSLAKISAFVACDEPLLMRSVQRAITSQHPKGVYAVGIIQLLLQIAGRPFNLTLRLARGGLGWLLGGFV